MSKVTKSEILEYASSTEGRASAPLEYKIVDHFTDSKQLILLPLSPKSSVTYLRNVLSEYLGSHQCTFSYTSRLGNRDIHIPKLIELCSTKHKKFVAHQHTFSWQANLRLIKRWNINVVYVNRPILDCINSLVHMVEAEWVNKGFPKKHGGFHFLGGPFLEQMTKSERRSYILRCSVPWYLSYNMGWIEARRAIAKPKFTLIHYDELASDNLGTVSKILGALGVTELDQNRLQSIQKKLIGDPTKIRLRKGKTTSSTSEFTTEDLDFYHQMLKPVAQILRQENLY